jgi:hypothetical protein
MNEREISRLLKNLMIENSQVFNTYFNGKSRENNNSNISKVIFFENWLLDLI